MPAAVVAAVPSPNWLVDSADGSAALFVAAGGRVLVAAFDGPVGRITVVEDPFGNRLVLLDLSTGPYSAAGDPPGR